MGGRIVRPELSFVASLFDGDVEKITTLGKVFDEKTIGALRPLPHSRRYGAEANCASRRLITISVTAAARAQMSAPVAIVAGVPRKSAMSPACKLPSGIIPPKMSVQIPMTRPRISSGTMLCRTVLEVEK